MKYHSETMWLSLRDSSQELCWSKSVYHSFSQLWLWSSGIWCPMGLQCLRWRQYVHSKHWYH